MYQVQYKTKIIRFLAAFSGAFYVVLFARLSEIRDALLKPTFYLAFITSFFIALLLVNIVHQSWKRLDQSYPWKNYPFKRLILQLLLGIGLPAFFDVLFITLFFTFKGQNIFINGFFRHDLPVICFLIFLFNVYYASYYCVTMIWRIYYMNATEGNDEYNNNPNTGDSSELDSKTDILNFRFKGSNISVYIDDILLVYRSNRKLFTVTRGKGILQSNDTLLSIESQLPKTRFIRINRRAILNVTASNGYKKGMRRETLSPIFKDNLEDLFVSIDAEILLVTKEYKKDFQERF